MAKKGKRAKGKGKGTGSIPANPPEFQAISLVRKKFRFYHSVAGSSFSLNEGQLLAMPGTMCTVTNSTVVAMQVSVKINRITIWGAPPVTGSAGISTVGIRWIGTPAQAGNTTALMMYKSDTSNNPTHAPRVSAVPPPGCRASFWTTADNSGADYLCSWDAPVDSIIEFDLTFNHGMPPAVGSFTTGVVTGTLGVMYWLAITAAAGSGVIIPTSLATTS
jgi:hypothetical protein